MHFVVLHFNIWSPTSPHSSGSQGHICGVSLLRLLDYVIWYSCFYNLILEYEHDELTMSGWRKTGPLKGSSFLGKVWIIMPFATDFLSRNCQATATRAAGFST